MKLSAPYISLVILSLFAVFSCKKEAEVQTLKNDLLKKTTSPAIAGEPIEFVYALGTTAGKLQAASVEASIAGATGTGFSRYSWYTDRNTGLDASILAVRDLLTTGAVSKATFIDTNAISLRYFYIVPTEAKGKTVSFAFSGTSTTGGQVSYNSPSYTVSKMDIKRSIPLTDGSKAYVSITDMAAYTKAEVDQNNISQKIDFVYIYRATLGSGNYTFGHALVALNNTQYINDLGIPAGWTKNTTLLDKRVDVRDGQLKNDPILNQYIDDIDLQNTTFPNAANNVFGMGVDQGAFVKTSDGTTAYVYVNAVDNAKKTMTISIKRLKQ